MRYWWVNQNQTFRQEISGGYLWSPKRNANGARNPFYEFMREIAPGDLVFSFADTRIIAVGIVGSYCYESPKPNESGAVGLNWGPTGWRVRVRFTSLLNRVRPKDHIDKLKAMLPSRYSPLQGTGNGIQSVYWTEVPTILADALIGLIGVEARIVVGKAEEVSAKAETLDDNADVELWEHHIEATIESDVDILETDREALIIARRGQGLFKQRVLLIEHGCRLTGVTDLVHLRASHCKPWRDSSNDERLDGENGLLLTPSIDHLFDRGFISFENSGELVISPVAHRPSLSRMGVPIDRTVNLGGFTEGQKHFLNYHRDSVLLRAAH